MTDIFGIAMEDYLRNPGAQHIITYSSVSGEDVLPVHYLFRDFSEMPRLEQEALKRSSGKILDIGCGAGSHSLYLQKKGIDVLPIDISPGAISICHKRGLKNARVQDIFELKEEKFNTILALMNGIGVCGRLNRLEDLLLHLKSLLNKSGRILTDSSDIGYLFENEDYYLQKSEAYYGEVFFSMEYNGIEGEVFEWVYIDFETLKQTAENCGFICTKILDGTHFDYLAELTRVD